MKAEKQVPIVTWLEHCEQSVFREPTTSVNYIRPTSVGMQRERWVGKNTYMQRANVQ